VHSGKFEIHVETNFAAAHRLRGYKGECENLHGHNWRVEVTLQSDKLNGLGMVMDFREVKRILAEVVRKFDHVFLNDLDEFSTLNPTTENIAMTIHKEISNRLPEGIKVSKVTAWESDGCGASYSE